MSSNGHGARAEMIKLLGQRGWLPDPTVTAASRAYGLGERKQHPHAFVRDAERGGQYLIVLDYVVKDSYGGRYDDRLRGVDVYYRATPDSDRKLVAALLTPGKWRRGSGLFQILGPGTLRQRAERLIKDIDLALWLGKEADFAERLKTDALMEEQRQDRKDREAPLPVTVSQEGCGSEWKQLTNALKTAACRVDDADGKSDLPALIVDVHVALDNVRAVLNDDAQDDVFTAMVARVNA